MDFYLKLKILYLYLHTAFGDWRVDIWNHDLDSYYCCNGNECGCMGTTVRQVYGEK